MSAPRVGFCVCELALDANDRCYVPDLVRRKMLRFLPAGHLETPRPLPRAMRPSQNCMTATGGSVYVSGQFGDRWFGGSLALRLSRPSPVVHAVALHHPGMSQARLLVADPSRGGGRILRRSAPLRPVAVRGALPGQLAYSIGLAREVNGNACVATYRVVWRFNAASHVDAVYWSPDDDEVE